jgi:hypothetical protein
MKELIPECLMPDEPFFVRAVVAFVISWNIHDNFELLHKFNELLGRLFLFEWEDLQKASEKVYNLENGDYTKKRKRGVSIEELNISQNNRY